MRYKIGFVSLGCPKNLTDTETMIALSEKKHILVTNPAEADIIVVNTCGFIESAKQESIDTIIEMGQYKNNGNLKKLIVAGCLAQRYTEEILEELPEVDAVVGTGSFYEIAEVIDELETKDKVVRKGDINSDMPVGLPRTLATPKSTAYLKIADGCNNNCTYCIIPKLRGKYRSVPEEDVLKEAAELAKRGVSELILVAQDTTMYGIDLYKKPSLAGLLKKLCKTDGIRWIRLQYCYPENVTDELIDTIAEEEKICKYIDIPFQHASNAVLKNMKRRSTFEKNCDIIKKLREKIPGIIIRSTFITGFPGETEEDFKILKEFVKKSEFERLGVFTYSAEEGTKAAEMENQTDEEIKISRRNEIMELQSEISLKKNKEKIGSQITVLCEEKIGENLYAGRSEADSPDVDGSVVFKGNAVPGQYVKITVTAAKEYDLEGVMNEFTE